MIDFHAHILPYMDDGAEDMAMSLAMLKESHLQGVSMIAATSHCYPRGQESVNHFIERRDHQLQALRDAAALADYETPRILSGCELNLYTDISSYENLECLCLEGTNYLLLEMPPSPWRDWQFECIYNLKTRGFRPVIAHINRYLGHTPPELNSLFDLDLIYQINAEAFLNRTPRKSAARLLCEGHAHILGSDTHNMSVRITQMQTASEILKKKFGQPYLDYFSKNSEAVLQNESVSRKACQDLPKLSSFTLMF